MRFPWLFRSYLVYGEYWELLKPSLLLARVVYLKRHLLVQEDTYHLQLLLFRYYVMSHFSADRTNVTPGYFIRSINPQNGWVSQQFETLSYTTCFHFLYYTEQLYLWWLPGNSVGAIGQMTMLQQILEWRTIPTQVEDDQKEKRNMYGTRKWLWAAWTHRAADYPPSWVLPGIFPQSKSWNTEPVHCGGISQTADLYHQHGWVCSNGLKQSTRKLLCS